MIRKLTLIEGTMYAGGDTAVNAVVNAKICGVIHEKSLHAALAKIQLRHPLLNVNIQEDVSGIPYFVTLDNIPEIPVRICERYTDADWQEEMTRECLTPFDVLEGPLMRMVWLKSQTVSDLILSCHHCICDGKAVLNLLEEILYLLDQPEMEMDTYESFSSLADFIPDRDRNSRINKLLILLTGRMVRLALLIGSSRKAIQRENPYLIHWRLDKQESASILFKCKTDGISMNAALGVVFLKAFAHVETIRSYTKLFCAVDMRKFIPTIKDNMLFAFPVTIGLGLKAKKGTGLWEMARLFRNELLTKIGKIDVYRQFMISESLLPLLPKIIKYAKTDKGAHDFTFSNMGNLAIKENYGTFVLDRLYSPITIFPFGNPSTLSTSTFRGQIDFMFTSDEHFLKKSDALQLKAKAMELLFEATGHEVV
ncbi:condensation domain-containing protein [Pedobacter cryoconitis]|uniref:NRPS condensation-like uncharacterized protein n=1 Tax=Pedobacter cryoconitis TaxID=188932 RepID=A0A7X0MK67_9SPHI|nr:condensation domain-containing protein [Pedobacter cryoconitis]MBB6501736.1 NRPS condensation-like uncharacterized protein [Pedobacter cryoconitis]